MKRIFYIMFAAQALLLLASFSATGVASAQNLTEETGLAQNPSGDIPMTQAVANLTNATSNPEDIKQMEVIGGTVNATLNQSGSGGMTDNMSSGSNMSSASNMSSGSNMSSAGSTSENYNASGS